jgi:hypothetical protein
VGVARWDVNTKYTTMAKLGYTWYAKDWRSNMDVLELSLQEKGFYRELIDECFIKRSVKIQLNERTFCRLHGINSRTFTKVLRKLSESSLIVIEDKEDLTISIPSVIDRLEKITKSSEGGKKSKTLKEKSTSKEKEKEKEKVKEKVIKGLTPSHVSIFNKWIEYRKEIKKPIKVTSTLKTLIKRFNNENLEVCEYIVNYSIENNYQGLFWENYKGDKKLKPGEVPQAKMNSPIG